MNIRRATESDIDGVMLIYEQVKLDRAKLGDNGYEARVQKEGFLLGLDDRENYQKLLTEAYSFLVAEENDKVVGYLVADHRDKFYDDEYKTWFDQKYKDIYYNDPLAMSLATIATDPSMPGKGVATALLKVLEEKLKGEGFKYLYSIITMAPLTNCPTIVWHTKNEFKRLAMGRPRERFFDLDWYSGVLLYKFL